MTETDDLLRDLTSDVEDATPMARARMRANVLRRIAPAPRPRWRRPARLVPLAGGVAAVAIVTALVVNTGSSGPSLVQKAEAAVAPPGEIVAITASVTGSETGGTTVLMRDWSLVGADGSLQMRRFISSRPESEPPDDEDTVVEVDGAGNLTRAVSWTPIDRLRFGLERDRQPYANSWAGLLRNAYRQGQLRDAGTQDGSPVLEGRLTAVESPGSEGCTTTARVALDTSTFDPRWLETAETCDGGPAETIARITFTVTRVPATPENLKLLKIGPWPVKEAVRIDPDTLAETPLPVAEAKREAGMD